MGLIEIEGMHFYGYHGHFEVEPVVRNEFLVDVSVENDCAAAAASDNLDDALNYQAIYDLIKSKKRCKSHRSCSNMLPDAFSMRFTASFPPSKKQKSKYRKSIRPWEEKLKKPALL